MNRSYSAMEPTSNEREVAEWIEKQLEESRLKLQRMKADIVEKRAEYASLESSLPNLKNALSTQELDLKNLRELLEGTEQDFKEASADFTKKKNRI